MWNEHLMTLPIEVAATKHWRSGYWKNWYTAYNFYDHSEIGNGGDIFVSESDDDVNEAFNWIDEAETSEADDDNHMWSVMGSPPFTDDARRHRGPWRQPRRNAVLRGPKVCRDPG